jgi:hypothetical protein
MRFSKRLRATSGGRDPNQMKTFATLRLRVFVLKTFASKML